MLEDSMPVKKNCNDHCAHCGSLHCPSNEQSDFNKLELGNPNAHEEWLVDARMLPEVSSGAYIKQAGSLNEVKKQAGKHNEHDQKLVDARMLNVVSSTKCRKTTNKSNDTNTRRDSEYFLKRVMASFDKMRSFLKRRPRALTHMQAHDTSHALASAREPLVRSNSH